MEFSGVDTYLCIDAKKKARNFTKLSGLKS
jgi:hypothetical protein